MGATSRTYDSPGRTTSRGPSVVVIGAGVSGCACAAQLAWEGVAVTLINSAMDRVGLPAYGPDMVAEGGDWNGLRGVLDSLPSVMRSVWLDGASRPADGSAIINIDRRRISIETKRLLESVPGLGFRQGFVVDLRVRADGENAGPGCAMEVETIFGEVLEADAVVVAAGLSLGGRTLMGADLVVEGGRYGEPPSDGLKAALERLGAQFRDVGLDVGARAAVRALLSPDAGGDTPNQVLVSSAGSGDRERVVGLVLVDDGAGASEWPLGYPPAPHLDPELRGSSLVVSERASGDCGSGARRVVTPLVSPDGGATSEVYLAADWFALEAERSVDRSGAGSRVPSSGSSAEAAAITAGGCDGLQEVLGLLQIKGTPLTRIPVKVIGGVVVNVSDTGRLVPATRSTPVWVVGRAGGAADYASSLLSGVGAARDVASHVAGFPSGKRGAGV